MKCSLGPETEQKRVESDRADPGFSTLRLLQRGKGSSSSSKMTLSRSSNANDCFQCGQTELRFTSTVVVTQTGAWQHRTLGKRNTGLKSVSQPREGSIEQRQEFSHKEKISEIPSPKLVQVCHSVTEHRRSVHGCLSFSLSLCSLLLRSEPDLSCHFFIFLLLL